VNQLRGCRLVREDSVRLEEDRLHGVAALEDYPSFHERHRLFPAIFEDRKHQRVLDVAAGVGCSASRIKNGYEAELVCNEVSPTALKVLEDQGLKTVSFNLDSAEEPFPLADGSFDAVVALATIEHLVHIDHFVREIHRILTGAGYLYVSAPNYSGLTYLLPFIVSGRTFHDPMSPSDRYEFYAHVRYFTYRTMLEYFGSFGFVPEAVYLGAPKESSRYLSLRDRSKLKAWMFRSLMIVLYSVASPRWGAEPVICFRKHSVSSHGVRPRKVVL
jgi:ubiquinone/menaquinone biosynthesis C-methylase UbiE